MLVSVPKGRVITDLSETLRQTVTRLRPERRTGTATLTTLDSLIGWADRFKSDESVLYANADTTAPSLTCIANYHAAGPADETGPTGDAAAAFRDHRGRYDFPLSTQWAAWQEVDGQPLDMTDLGYFIEDHAEDLLDPTPYMISGKGEPGSPWENAFASFAKRIGARFGTAQQLFDISREFRVNESSNLSAKTNRANGTGSIQFLNEHQDPDGNPITLPQIFLILIPVFQDEAAYPIAVRFAYRKVGPGVKFTMRIHDATRVFSDAFTGATTRAQEATGLPLFYGEPE